MRGYRNTLKPLNILPPEAEERVHRAALQMLRDHGVIFEDPRALDLFRKAGVRVDDSDQRVFFPPEFVEEQIRTPLILLIPGRGIQGAAIATAAGYAAEALVALAVFRRLSGAGTSRDFIAAFASRASSSSFIG